METKKTTDENFKKDKLDHSLTPKKKGILKSVRKYTFQNNNYENDDHHDDEMNLNRSMNVLEHEPLGESDLESSSKVNSNIFISII